jgi:hypothetical protein
MADGKKYFDIRSNVDPIDNKLYMEFIKGDAEKDTESRLAAKSKKDFNVSYKKGEFKVGVSKSPEGKGFGVSWSKKFKSGGMVKYYKDII